MKKKAKKNKTIAVAVDFSKNSDYALLRAVEIAKAKKMDLTLLHITQKKSLDHFLDATLKDLLPAGLWLTTEEYKETMLQEKIAALGNVNININYEVISKGDPAAKILRYVKKHRIDLLVMGAHGNYSFRDSFVGTTAEHVAKKTTCPVLIVKKAPDKKYSKILIPTDFSKASKKALTYAFQLFPDSNIRLLHVGDYEFDHLLRREEEIPKGKMAKMRKAIYLYLEDKMKKFMKGFGRKLGKHAYTISLGYPAPIIIQEAKKLNRDLVVMGTQGHRKTHYLFIGSVAIRVLVEINKDILLVPPK